MELTTARPGRILEAALDAFSENGFAATTIADVRKRSGASVGSIYHHFGDKEGIAAALYVECLRDYHEGLIAVLADGPAAEPGIRRMVGHHLGWVARRPRHARFLFERPRGRRIGDRRIEALNRDLFAVVREWLRPHQSAGRIRRMPLELST